MLQVTNRFHSPMRAQSTSQNRVQNKSQSVNFSGGRATAIRMGIVVGPF